MPLDKPAVRILTSTYWSSLGWKREPAVSDEDFAYAQAHGVMFDPISLSHDEAIDAAISAAAALKPIDVVNAFVGSLSSRELDVRSALGSYAVARHIRQHAARPSATSKMCSYCGLYARTDVDLNALNFERVKWGGVRHDQPTYIAFDLGTLRNRDVPRTESGDYAILRAILDAARSLPPKARLGDLDKALVKVLPSNSAERRTLIGILGYAGVLVDRKRPDFRRDFVPVVEREGTPWHTDDWPYPVQWWNASHGVNQSAINDWFPNIGAD
ncbi:hypothetical protein ACVWZA_001198 [Sphingomonas sp. UYAg733]